MRREFAQTRGSILVSRANGFVGSRNQRLENEAACRIPECISHTKLFAPHRGFEAVRNGAWILPNLPPCGGQLQAAVPACGQLEAKSRASGFWKCCLSPHSLYGASVLSRGSTLAGLRCGESSAMAVSRSSSLFARASCSLSNSRTRFSASTTAMFVYPRFA